MRAGSRPDRAARRGRARRGDRGGGPRGEHTGADRPPSRGRARGGWSGGRAAGRARSPRSRGGGRCRRDVCPRPPGRPDAARPRRSVAVRGADAGARGALLGTCARSRRAFEGGPGRPRPEPCAQGGRRRAAGPHRRAAPRGSRGAHGSARARHGRTRDGEDDHRRGAAACAGVGRGPRRGHRHRGSDRKGGAAADRGDRARASRPRRGASTRPRWPRPRRSRRRSTGCSGGRPRPGGSHVTRTILSPRRWSSSTRRR